MKLNLFFLSTAAMVNAAYGTDPVVLGTAEDYAILAKAGISTVPNSAITGDIAVSPISSAAITGFSLTTDSTASHSTSTQVVGEIYAADGATPIPAKLTAAVGDMETAYLDAESRGSDESEFSDGLLAGKTLTAGVYTFTTNVLIAGKDLTFSGSATDVFIIQMTGDFTAAAGIKVILSGGVQAKNIFWQVAGIVEVGAGAHMEGIILAKTDVTFITGSSLNGRILSQTFVALQMATITQPPSL